MPNVRDVSWSPDCYWSVMEGVTKKGKALKNMYRDLMYLKQSS